MSPPGTIVLKEGVSLTGIRPELLVALWDAATLWGTELGRPLVVTSVNDGWHSRTSLHYAGAAIDLRTRDLELEDAERVAALLKAALGDDFDVVLEHGPPHLHVEWQPRRR